MYERYGQSQQVRHAQCSKPFQSNQLRLAANLQDQILAEDSHVVAEPLPALQLRSVCLEGLARQRHHEDTALDLRAVALGPQVLVDIPDTPGLSSYGWKAAP